MPCVPDMLLRVSIGLDSNRDLKGVSKLTSILVSKYVEIINSAIVIKSHPNPLVQNCYWARIMQTWWQKLQLQPTFLVYDQHWRTGHMELQKLFRLSISPSFYLSNCDRHWERAGIRKIRIIKYQNNRSCCRWPQTAREKDI